METKEQIERFREFFEQGYLTLLHKEAHEGHKSVNIDFAELSAQEVKLSELLLEQPEEIIKAAELALEDLNIPDKKLRVRILNLPKSSYLKIRNIRSAHLNRFHSFEGIVRQSSDVRPQVTNARFECPSCGNIISILQLDQKFKEPSRCTCGRKGQFRLLDKDLVDAQRLVIEEPPEALEGGEQPKRLSVFLKEDLVEPHMERRTTPGSKIRITGVVKEVPIQLKTGVQSIRYDIAADAIHVEPIEQTYEDIEVTEEDKEKIHDLAKDPALFERLINSICPSVYGHNDTKEAMVLQLFGGVKRERPDGTKLRGDLHILLVGDPGAAKSTLLTFMEKAAPKARYVAGRSASGAGITATVVKDEFLRGWALEAGAVVLANKGLLLIDEMDKMSVEDTSALHEAMAQQQVTIAKANIQACYSSDTEVLTDEGWKNYKDVKNAKIAQYDPLKKSIEFLSHKGLYEYDYNGPMYYFKNKRNDILVTPNHKMLAREYSQKNLRAIEAQDLNYNSIKFVNSGNYENKETKYFILPQIKHKQNRTHPKYTNQHVSKKIPMDLWVEFLGYYLSEGGIQASPTFGIPQKSEKNVKKIRTCLKKLSKVVGFTLSETKEGVYTRFQVTNTQLFTNLAETCGHNCYTKKLPIKLSDLSKRQLKILYDALMLGDGSSDGKSLSSTSKDLIDIFQAITCLIGKSASQHIHYDKGYRKNRQRTYRVVISSRIEPGIRKKSITKTQYKGKVFCFSTHTGFFVTRRNGRIAIQGNTLRAETSILAAANPKLGRFDPFQPIATQINLPPALINRFDLIFPVRDLPSKDVDEKIALHILEQDFKGKTPEIPSDFLKKYVSYAKQSIIPKLSKQAIAEIKNFYVSLRNAGSHDEGKIRPIPISARQLESIIRLAEASARIRLSETVTQADAQRAIRLVTYCLTQVGIDPETGQIDIDRISTGITASQRSRISVMREIIDHLEQKVGKSIPIEEVVAEAAEKGISESQVEEVLERFKREGHIFEPKRGQISKL